MNTALLIIHGLVAVALLGAITHQTIAAWVPAHGRHGSFLTRFRGVPSGSFTNAVVVLYAVSALLGAVLYLPFRTDVRPDWSVPAIGRRSVSLTSRSISSLSDWHCCRPIGFVGNSSVPANRPERRPS